MLVWKGCEKVAKIINFMAYSSRQDTEGDNMHKKLIMEIREKPKKISDMPERAREVLNYFQIENSSGGVPIIEILTRLGIKVYQMELEPEKLSAYIAVNPKYQERYGTNKITCVNSRDNIGHKRFALAHELAHYLFDFKENDDIVYYNTYFADDNLNDEAERRANAFAANLLMPEREFKNLAKDWEKQGSKADTITELAKYFQVSATAVIKRCQELQMEGYSIS